MIADYGIFLEIFGFILMLLFWREPHHQHSQKWEKLFKKIPKLIEKNYRWEELNPSRKHGWSYMPNKGPLMSKYFVYYWSICKYLGFFFIILGVFLQHSEINNWFSNNFPNL